MRKCWNRTQCESPSLGVVAGKNRWSQKVCLLATTTREDSAKARARRGRAGQSKLVSDKWSHIPWVRGSRYGMAHGSGVFSMHRIQEVSMPFGPEEGLSKPATRTFPERPKAETTSVGETRNIQLGKALAMSRKRS